MKFNPEQMKKPTRHEVDPGEYLRIESPDRVETEGVGPCHAMGIINTKTRVGYLGHFFFETKDAEALLKQALSESSSPDDLSVALAGNIPFSKEELMVTGGNIEKDTEAHKKFGEWLLQLITDNNIKNFKNNLATKYTNISYKMEVNPSANKITISKEDYGNFE